MEKPNIILSFLFSMVDNTIFIGILSKFRSHQDNYKSIDTLVIIIVSIFTCLFTEFSITPFIKLTFILMILFLATFLYNLKFHQRVLVIIMYYFILIISELLVTLLASNILDKTVEGLKYTYFFLGLLSKFLSALIFTLINRKFLNTKIILPKILNYVMILILSLSTISMVLLFYSSLVISSESTILILFFICLFILFISLGTMVMYYNANTFYINLQKETTKRIYDKSYEKFIINAELRSDTLSKIWHDMANHIKVLEKINDIEDEKYIKYVNSIKDKFKEIPNTINTGNRLIDIILNDKYSEAVMQGIDFDIKAIAPPKVNIDDMDLSSILFNTIDNAIEACMNSSAENKYINLELYPDANFLCYKIRNNYNSTNGNSHMRTYLNKKKYISSGYGLSIIEDIINKYDGYMDIKKNDMEYLVTIILPLNDHSVQKITT